MTPSVRSLSTGAEARRRGGSGPLAVVFLNGGSARPVAGTWSATSELLVTELVPRFPALSFVELRYRVKSWNDLVPCVADAHAALDLVELDGVSSVLVVGFSMGGAVAVPVLDRPSVYGLAGLAPWIPERMQLDTVRGKRFDVVHGTRDGFLPGIPGVSPRSSRAGFERALAAGATGTYTLMPGALHGAAVRWPSGRLLRLPRWKAWVDETARHVTRFAESASG
jgi:pimeloyl-ACP methyl ester carboxylesterase